MKKLFGLLPLTACLIMCGIVFNACKKDIVTDVFLSYRSDNENIDFMQVNSGDKKYGYELKATYGVEIDVNDFTLNSAINHSEVVSIDKASYTLENNLPTGGVPEAGTYTLKFGYEGWTNEVTVIIEKKIINLPQIESGNEVFYDGKDYTPRIVYDKNAVTMLDDSERKFPKESYDDSRYYNVEFELKDKKNYRWEDSSLGSDNYTYRFAIIKRQLSVDLSQYIKLDSSDPHCAQGYNTLALSYDLRENYPKTLSDILALSSLTVDESALSEFSDLVELKLVNTIYPPSAEIEKIEASGAYYLVLTVKDEACYAIGTTTQTTSFMAWLTVLQIIIT